MAESKGHFITQLNKYDVLCGRGLGPNERAGNINFRDLVYSRKTEYLAINPRDHKNKNRIAREIVKVVRSLGGRFLKRTAVDLGDDETEAYELVNEKVVLEKAKQTLRQNRTGRKESSIKANIYASQSNMEEVVSHLPPQLDPYQAFVSHLQQANYRPRLLTKDEYLAINPRDHKNKNRIAREIVEIVRSRGGRFLKKAAVDIAEDGTEAYELADETAVLEKAKQALRQNRTGRTESYITADVYARSQSNMVEGVSHLPPQPNPYHAFVSHLQQANYAMSPADLGDDETEAYELVNEKVVLEKAKQTLRQNRTRRKESSIKANIYAISQPNMVEGVSHRPPQLNPYQAFVSHLQQANYAMSPAESAIRNLQMQNYMAQQQHQCNPHQENYTPRQNPYFSTSGKGVDHGQYIHAIAMQQYKPTQEHSIPNNIIPGRPNLSTTTATDPDHIMFHLGQKMKQNMHNVSGLSGNTASIPRGREPCDKSITSVKTTGNSFSDSQMKALEDIFVSASQSIPKVRIDSRSQQHGTSTPHLQQANYAMSPAESAIRNLQMQNYYMAQQQQQCTLQENSMPRQNPCFETAGGGVDPGQNIHAIAMQQYKTIHEHSIPNNMSGQPNLSTATATDSARVMCHLGQQMNQNMHNVSGLSGNTASIPREKEPSDKSIA
eukprot:CAMPEP_0202029944 /NCGR_PEP_ID=MMETSP0905-20130828/64237_1 /ASSEMBLY_ACC=CAM_ASM_000554 /TAXON_ID=420261 /ORGANISM="Thalassiosira antarctica, Strain CCMP982" /LENGTH=664 /DNA_ID=CAMNT_0048593727 /DNA_START=89 /DNA_END=2081 /DNA_ORIENTATION=-